MRTTLVEIDRLLRGESTRAELLREGRIAGSARELIVGGALLALFYGLCMGLFALLRHPRPGWWQLAGSALKVPLLFYLTLAVTMPSLYVFSALARSRLGPRQTSLLLLACTSVTAAVLASLGPVTVFFTLSTKSYPFVLLLNVAVFTIAGVVGVGFLRRVSLAVFGGDGDAAERSSGDRRARLILVVWLLIYAVVGAQMGWILRPFVGNPELPTVFIRETDSNFFRGVLDAIQYGL